MCSPRPVSASRLADRGTGTVVLGSATAHITHGPGLYRPSRISDRDGGAPGPGRACRSALVSISDTTTAMSSQRPVTPHRCKVATVNSRARWTGPASVPGARGGISGRQAQPAGAVAGDSRQVPPATPAMAAASVARSWIIRPAPGLTGCRWLGDAGRGRTARRWGRVGGCLVRRWGRGGGCLARRQAGRPGDPTRRPGRPSALARWPGRPSRWPWPGPTARPGGWRGTRPWSAGTAGRPAARERRSAIRPGWPGPGRRPRRARCDQRARKCRNPFRTT